jgi:hypothetical protein
MNWAVFQPTPHHEPDGRPHLRSLEEVTFRSRSQLPYIVIPNVLEDGYDLVTVNSRDPICSEDLFGGAIHSNFNVLDAILRA